MRAARLRTCSMPRPGRRILPPFFRFLTIISTIWVSISLACRFGISCVWDRLSAIFRNVSTDAAVAAALAAFLATFAGAVAAALLAALREEALEAVVFTGTLFRAAAFAEVVLGAALAI